MTAEELHRVMRMRVAGVTGDDLRDELITTFKLRLDLIPTESRQSVEALPAHALESIIDIAAIACQCRLRRAHRLPEPFSK